MEPFQRITSKVMPLPLNNVDTDMIIPAQYLTSISREGYGANVFRRLRDEDPQFPLDQARYSEAKVLLVGENFGCGSSREHAVWALMGAGFRVVLGKSFADIFGSNAGKNGLLLVKLPATVVDNLFERARERELTVQVDLSRQLVMVEGEEVSFEIDPFLKHCLLEGMDDLDYILARTREVEAFRKQQEAVRFYRTTEPNRKVVA